MSNNLINDERMRIWQGIEKLYANSEKTRTPIYQDSMYQYMRKLVWPAQLHPPKHFRDIANGE